jgi:hypothetical protein
MSVPLFRNGLVGATACGGVSIPPPTPKCSRRRGPPPTWSQSQRWTHAHNTIGMLLKRNSGGGVARGAGRGGTNRTVECIESDLGLEKVALAGAVSGEVTSFWTWSWGPDADADADAGGAPRSPSWPVSAPLRAPPSLFSALVWFRATEGGAGGGGCIILEEGAVGDLWVWFLLRVLVRVCTSIWSGPHDAARSPLALGPVHGAASGSRRNLLGCTQRTESMSRSMTQITLPEAHIMRWFGGEMNHLFESK